ncbi:MAG: TIM barrel protein [Candidatus Diapherotrites archaeon]|uniref:TIM barrel protein n=1 Tax=Candidatus Iainarchaeum sp. TaxID=3101447 RepID=A0A939CA58_9ARCH|nr:TIM barrel protein [Candidatus Diapherotrites archaeon]
MTAKMLFGTAGVPGSSKGSDSVSGIERIRELKLDAMELEFVRGVHMSEATARQVKKAAEKNKVLLRVHAPYFINLNSKEHEKVEASKKRILDSARVGEAAGAKIVTFHPAYFQGMGKKEVLEKVIAEIEEIAKEIAKNKWRIRLAPETTGKASQVGSLGETLEMCRKVKGVEPMVDWSHLHARDNGRFKGKRDFLDAIDEIPKKFLKNLQMHASGIRFTAKGERNHLNMDEGGNTFNYKWLLEALHERKVSGCIICESPDLEGDALLMQKHWKKL